MHWTAVISGNDLIVKRLSHFGNVDSVADQIGFIAKLVRSQKRTLLPIAFFVQFTSHQNHVAIGATGDFGIEGERCLFFDSNIALLDFDRRIWCVAKQCPRCGKSPLRIGEAETRDGNQNQRQQSDRDLERPGRYGFTKSEFLSLFLNLFVKLLVQRLGEPVRFTVVKLNRRSNRLTEILKTAFNLYRCLGTSPTLPRTKNSHDTGNQRR